MLIRETMLANPFSQADPIAFEVSALSVMLIVLPVLLIAVHIVLAAVVRRSITAPAVVITVITVAGISLRLPIILAAAIGLAIGSTALWWVVTLPMAYWSAFCCIGTPDFNFYNTLYSNTLALPFFPCRKIPQLELLLGQDLCYWSACWFLPVFMFVTTLMIFAVVRPRRKSRTLVKSDEKFADTP